MALKIRLVFQGGGARLVNLLAAAEAIRAFELEGKIKITRVAGTSAGAIVAAILATGEDPSKLKEALKARREELLKKFPKPSLKTLLWNLGWGKSVWDMSLLREFLSDFIPTNLKFKEAKIPLSIIAANLDERQMHTYTQEENREQLILNAVLDSAAVPFALRTWNKQQGTILVDGGLCENLPVVAVGGTDDADGKVVAIGFQKPVGGSPTTIVEFALALLDVAINNSEAKARVLLPANRLCLLKANIPTFDFPHALKEGLGAEFDLTRNTVSSFLNDYIDAENAQVVKLVESMDTWMHSDKIAREIMSGVGEMYYTQHSGQKIRYLKGVYEITANSLGENPAGVKDSARLECQIVSLDEPIYCMAFAINRPPGSKFTGMMEIRVWDSNNRPIKIKALPMFKPEDADEYRRVCVCFMPALPPRSGSYRLLLLDEPTEIMERLKNGEVDEISFGLPRSTNEGADIKLVLHVPNTFRKIKLQQSAPNDHPVLTMSSEQLADFIAPFGFVSYGWYGEKVPPTNTLIANIKTV